MTAAHASLGTALAAAQLSLEASGPSRGKTAKGLKGRNTYKYAGLDDLLAFVRPALAAQGVALTQVLDVLDSGRQVLVTCIWIDVPGADGSSRRDELVSRYVLRMDGSHHDNGGEITYARRYSLEAIVGVSATDDDDAQGAVRNGSGGGRREAMPPKRQHATSARAELDATVARVKAEAAKIDPPKTRKPKAAKADRGPDAPHHPSFVADRARFMASVSAAGISYEKELKPACLAKGWGKPSTWAQSQRDGLVHSLQPGGSGWAKLGLDDPSAGRQPGDESEEIDAGSADDYSAATDAAELRA